MFKDVQFKVVESNTEKYLFIDVRSPREFQDSTIPGAINIPLFDNEERAEVGTIFKQNGQNQAIEHGIEIVSPKIPALVHKVRDSLAQGQRPIFFCWRGGMRSKTVATLYDLAYKGDNYRLEGGYRAYRKYILDQIEETKIEVPTFVLHGMTGVGKTLLLYKLKEMGLTILDLEGLAGHRGSLFGGIGDIEPVNQKTFDSRLYQFIKDDLPDANAIVIEAESKRVGKALLPDNVLTAKENGIHVLVHASVNTRVDRIIEEYQPLMYKDSIHEALKRIEKRLPTEIRQPMADAFENNDFHTIVKLLLEHYYDPKYQYSTEQYDSSFFEVNSDDLDLGAKEIAQYIEEKLQKSPIHS